MDQPSFLFGSNPCEVSLFIYFILFCLHFFVFSALIQWPYTILFSLLSIYSYATIMIRQQLWNDFFRCFRFFFVILGT